MALPTRQLTLTAGADEGVRYTVRLDRDAHYQGQDIPLYEGEMLNDTDPVVLDIFPCVLLGDDSEYIITGYTVAGHVFIREAFCMPDADTTWPVTGGTSGGGSGEIYVGNTYKQFESDYSLFAKGGLSADDFYHVPEEHVDNDFTGKQPQVPRLQNTIDIFLGARPALEPGQSIRLYVPKYFSVEGKNAIRFLLSGGVSGGLNGGSGSGFDYANYVHTFVHLKLLDSQLQPFGEGVSPMVAGGAYLLLHVGVGLVMYEAKPLPQMIQPGNITTELLPFLFVDSSDRVRAFRGAIPVKFNTALSTGGAGFTARVLGRDIIGTPNSISNLRDGLALPGNLHSVLTSVDDGAEGFLFFNYANFTNGNIWFDPLDAGESFELPGFLVMTPSDENLTGDEVPESWFIWQGDPIANKSGVVTYHLVIYAPIYTGKPPGTPFNEVDPTIRRRQGFNTYDNFTAYENGNSMPADFFQHGGLYDVEIDYDDFEINFLPYTGPAFSPTDDPVIDAEFSVSPGDY